MKRTTRFVLVAAGLFIAGLSLPAHSLAQCSTNTSTGTGALSSNTTGCDNSAFGYHTLFGNTTGYYNTAVGEYALRANNADFNTAVGSNSMYDNTSGAGNTAVGLESLANNTTGSHNVAMGLYALETSVTASDNTALGWEALWKSTGDDNTAVGYTALVNNTSGTNNIALGYQAGSSLTTGSGNIDIGNNGVAAESNTIRVGSATQTATYLAGVYSPTISTRAVYVNSSGQLGTLSSSRRFKTDIRPLADKSDRLLKLRPVSFHYKKEVEADGAIQYGLIAEEVAKVYPELVDLGPDGKPYSVRYHLLGALLLSEVQKQSRQIARVEAENEALRTQIRQTSAQGEQIQALSARLIQLEATLASGPGPVVRTALEARPAL